MSPPKVGVIGLGHWGKNLLRNFSDLDALSGLYDIDNDTVTRHAGEYPGAKPFDRLDAVLAAPDIDAIAIATPAPTHGELVAAALAAGKHVFVEKPLCLDLAGGKRLAREAHSLKLTLMVGHLLLYHPAFDALSRMVAQGKLGSLRYIYSNRLSLGKFRREENALWSFAPHDVSMILSLTGAMPEKVTASGGAYLSPPVSDTTLSHLTFSGGVQAHIFVSWLHPYKDHRMVVVGSDGMAAFDDVEAGERKLLHYPHAVGWDGDIPTMDRAEAEPIPYEPDEPLARECAHFLECVATGRAPISDAEEGLRVLTVIDACQRSLSTGRPVRLDGV